MYKTQSTDTTEEAEKFQIELLRRAGAVRRFQMMRSLTATTRRLSWQNLCRVHSGLTALEKRVFFVKLLYGEELAQGFKEYLEQQKEVSVALNEDIFPAITPVVEVFEALGVPYLVGGSVASSFRGLARSTNDADLVADLEEHHIAELVNRLKDAYYLSEDAIRTAVAQRTSFNLIHLDTMLKVDVFVLKHQPFEQTTFARREAVQLDASSPRLFNTYTPEDIILQKLVWYEAGGRVSERQWLDILGVLKLQAHNLDRPYLEKWATHVGLLDLLNQAIADAGL